MITNRAPKKAPLSLTRWIRTTTAVLGLSAIACQPPPLNDPQEAADPLPPLKVDLPPQVKLEGSLPPETYPDLKLRIQGLLARRDKYLGQKVLVRGYVVDKFHCPEEAKRCEKPHVWLADAPAGGDKKLMLVGLSEGMVEILPEGEAQVITGRFERSSDDGFVQSSGLLIYESIEGVEEPPPPKKKKGRR